MAYNIVAVDFDGVIVDFDKWRGVGVFGLVKPGCIEELQKLRDHGYWITVWTTRGDDIDGVRSFLLANGVPFDSINCNPPDVPPNLSDKKVIADVYVDDRALFFGGRWQGLAQRIHRRALLKHKLPKDRPVLPGLGLLGRYFADQISLAVSDMRQVMHHLKRQCGADEWVVDRVEARDKHTLQKFTVDLAFNYQVMPIEFELLSPVSGWVPQLSPNRDLPTLSHVGFHIPLTESLEVAMDRFERAGFKPYAHIETLAHSSCPGRYEYAFVETRFKLGFDSKLIRKLAPTQATKGGKQS